MNPGIASQCHDSALNPPNLLRGCPCLCRWFVALTHTWYARRFIVLTGDPLVKRNKDMLIIFLLTDRCFSFFLPLSMFDKMAVEE